MNIDVFIDAENFPAHVTLDILKALAGENTVYPYIVGNRESISPVYRNIAGYFQESTIGKNSADIWLTTMIVEDICIGDSDLIMVISSDRDFLPVVKLASEHEKRLILVVRDNGYKNMLSLLVNLHVNMAYVSVIGISVEGSKAPILVSSPLKRKGHPLINMCSGPAKTYLVDNYKGESVFLKTKNGNIMDIPFVNGMPFPHFSYLCNKFLGKPKGDTTKTMKIINESYLSLKNHRVYYSPILNTL